MVDAEPAGAEILKESSQKHSPQTLRVTQAEIFPGDARSMQGICKSMPRPGNIWLRAASGVLQENARGCVNGLGADLRNSPRTRS